MARDDTADDRRKSWDRVRRLFHGVLEQEVGRREDWLRRACRDDRDLLAEIRTLVRAHEKSDARFEQPLIARDDLSDGAGDPADPAAPRMGDRLGSYVLQRLLGSGGMARVFLATSSAAPASTCGPTPSGAEAGPKVAIKVLREDLAGDEVVRRFRAEEHVLAGLDHPSIARLLDAGTAPSGRPFLVMEYVDGLPIDLYCDLHAPALEQRLQLFARVCRAVHFAHQNLVVHRDLKPANILVTAEGAPKLLDFGIAKLLAPERLPVTVPRTLPGLGPMTPAYASPEQIRGGPVNTASDVYGLGVLLYELLAGRVPFEDRGPGDRSTLVRICTEEPEPPSRAARQPGWGRLGGGFARRLRGDLDRIVLKALRKDPVERYGSAEQLAEDVERFLAGRPILARAPTLRYLTARFLRRHRWGVGTAAAATAAGVIFVSLLVRAEHQAARERDRAEAVSTFLVDLFETAEPGSPDSDLTARELLERGAERIHGHLAGEPWAQVALRGTMGSAFLRLGLLDEAGAQFEEALRLARSLHPGDHPEVARALRLLGYQRYDAGAFEAAEPLLVEALAMSRRLFGDEHAETLEAMQYLGVLRRDLGDLEAAEGLLRGALDRARRIHGAVSEEVADALFELFNLLRLEQRFADAVPVVREALEIDRRMLGEAHPYYASSLEGLGQLYFRLGDLDAAEATLRQADAIRRRLFELGHPDLATGTHNLATVLAAKGSFGEAERLLREALEGYRRAYPDGHPHIAESLSRLATVYLGRDSPEQAVPVLRETLKVYQRFGGAGEIDGLETQVNLARALRESGHPEAAREIERAAEAALADFEAANGATSGVRTRTLVLRLYGVLRLAAGDAPAAEGFFRQVLELDRETYGGEHLQVARDLSRLGRALHARGRHEEAEARFAACADLFRRGLPAGHPELGNAVRRLAEERLHQGRFADAEPAAGESLALLRGSLGTAASATCRAAVALAEALRGQGRFDDSRSVLEQARRGEGGGLPPQVAVRCGLAADPPDPPASDHLD